MLLVARLQTVSTIPVKTLPPSLLQTGTASGLLVDTPVSISVTLANRAARDKGAARMTITATARVGTGRSREGGASQNSGAYCSLQPACTHHHRSRAAVLRNAAPPTPSTGRERVAYARRHLAGDAPHCREAA